MDKLHFSIDTENHLITLSHIKMNKNGFSYNNITFNKVNDYVVEVTYNKITPENKRNGIDANLTWGLNSIIKALHEYSEIFEFEL